jgi:hypothetical protein
MSFSPEGNGPNTLFDIIDFSLQGVLSVDAEENRGNMFFPGIECDGQWVPPLTFLHLYRIFG